ncbi:hypothetical protein FQR65_LT03677 [Abscondita terminalis]|nr:hypothetical protein FQR65_LT03677 [Abscondita terminalis]
MIIGNKWSKAVPSEPKDGIKSSRYRNKFGFTPSYLSEAKENMYLLLSNEYHRKWFAERYVYQQQTFKSVPVEKDKANIKRRYVQRIMKPNPSLARVMPIITLKRFAKASTKVETRRQ